jgi:hypothetical protein
MKNIIVILLLLAIVGCAHERDIRPDCKHWAVMGAYTIQQTTGQEAMIACGMGQMRERQWYDFNAPIGTIMSPHVQVVTTDADGNIVEWWRYDGVCWRPSHQEVAYVDIVMPLDKFIKVTIPK